MSQGWNDGGGREIRNPSSQAAALETCCELTGSSRDDYVLRISPANFLVVVQLWVGGGPTCVRWCRARREHREPTCWVRTVCRRKLQSPQREWDWETCTVAGESRPRP